VDWVAEYSMDYKIHNDLRLAYTIKVSVITIGILHRKFMKDL
jgi:hypothetical protein